jgi:hypothetical protein
MAIFLRLLSDSRPMNSSQGGRSDSDGLFLGVLIAFRCDRDSYFSPSTEDHDVTIGHAPLGDGQDHSLPWTAQRA